MNITELRAKATKIYANARDILSAADFSAEKQVEVEAMLAEADGFEARAKQLETINANLTAYEATDAREPVEARSVEVRGNVAEKAEKAFNDYLRGDIEARELRAQGIGSAAAGGNLVPNGFVATLIKSMYAYGPLNEGGPVTYLVTESGNPIAMPSFDDAAAKGALIAEGVEADETNLTFGQKTLGAYKYTSGVVKVSNELLQDAAIDPQAVVVSAMAERLGRILNEHFTKGTGSSQPSGLVTGASAGATAASATAISYEDLVNLLHSVDPAYRANGVFMFNDAILKAIRLLKDAEGRPIWNLGVAGGAPATILDRPYVVNNEMDNTMAATKVSAVYGDLSKFTVRRVREFGVKRLDEKYATSDQVGFVGFARYDSKVLDTRAIKKLTH